MRGKSAFHTSALAGFASTRKPFGFTLIELLVVISILALLMAILLPVLGKVRNQARSVVCRAHLKQWGTVLALYLEEYDGRFTRVGEEDSGLSLLLDAVEPDTSLVFERQGPPNHEPSGAAGETCINRHHGSINGLFLDFSVRPIGLKELWTLRWHLEWDRAGPWTKAGGVQPEDWPRWMRGFKDY